MCFKRYHFESDISKFFPTITFENGPIEIEVVWQNAVEPHSLPSFIEVWLFINLIRKFQKNDLTSKKLKIKENKNIWIKPPNENCDFKNDFEYENLQNIEDMPLQSTLPLSKSCSHYKCIQMEVSNEGQGASVGIASCSPLKPTPTCSLLRDYYTWLPKMKR